jgi:hypothetical protein
MRGGAQSSSCSRQLCSFSAPCSAFLTFDRSSHYVSDTLRPFLITMLPVWVVFGFAAQQLHRPRSVD